MHYLHKILSRLVFYTYNVHIQGLDTTTKCASLGKRYVHNEVLPKREVGTGGKFFLTR